MPPDHGRPPAYAGGHPAGHDPWGTRTATLTLRWLGLFLDGLGIAAVFYGVFFGTAMLGYTMGVPEDVLSLITVTCLLLVAAFYVIGTTTTWGRTPGKMLVGTRVIDIHTGRPPRPRRGGGGP
ncbi:RDD family protein [Nocardiopsis mangrovi]|uniref:RDD family protein n=1 Tax=Nocardiopsis mangrovi TaxID=1179818 RepID=A0ABV9DRY8_9ACTN